MTLLLFVVDNVKMLIREGNKIIKKEDEYFELKSCGCRYRDKICEYLCSIHQNKFILKLYNDSYKTQNQKEDSY